MSVSIMTDVWKMDIPTTEKVVLLALADAANEDGVAQIAVISSREGEIDLQRKTSLSERAVQGALKRLCAAGHLSRTEQPGKGAAYQVLTQKTCAQMLPARHSVVSRSTRLPSEART